MGEICEAGFNSHLHGISVAFDDSGKYKSQRGSESSTHLFDSSRRFRASTGMNATMEIRIEDPIGFGKQGGQQPNIKILIRPEAKVITANSQFTKLARIGLYQGCSIFHDREINADVVPLERNANRRPIHVFTGSS
jgi:hypothetical protein